MSKKPEKSKLTPAEALARLKTCNQDYLKGKPANAKDDDAAKRQELANGQAPFAVVVTCSDSRVPPERLFGLGLGQLFVIRNAGNTVDTVALGSIEYAVHVLGAPLVVVMGHESCGAVDAACQVVTKSQAFPGAIGRMIEPIIPAVLSVRDQKGDLLDHSVRANVSRTVATLRSSPEPMLQDPLKAGKLAIVGARYDLHDGRVDFFDESAVA